MAQKKNRKKPQSFFVIYRKQLTLAALFVITIIFIGLFVRLNTESNEVKITPHQSMRTLPAEIKRKLSLTPPATSFRVPILLYHYVEYVQDKKDTERQSLDIIPAIFDEQIKTLKDAGYTFMTASDLADVLDGKTQLPAKPVLITIDDGHWDLDTDILPILKKYNVKATAYIIPGFLGGSDFLSQQQLDDVAKSNLVEIGAHTVHHAYLKGMAADKAQYEIAESKTMLENELHRKVVSFAYPYGAFDEQAAKLVEEAGFKTAVSTIPGVDVTDANRYFIYRIRPGARTDQELLNYLQQNSYTMYGATAATKGD